MLQIENEEVFVFEKSLMGLQNYIERYTRMFQQLKKYTCH